MSRLDWALWPEARASCIADDEVDCGVPSAPRSGPGCDAWCVSSRDRCSRPVAWHRPPPEPCHGSALSADDRALVVRQNPKHISNQLVFTHSQGSSFRCEDGESTV